MPRRLPSWACNIVLLSLPRIYIWRKQRRLTAEQRPSTLLLLFTIDIRTSLAVYTGGDHS